jgi:hypothetical protein
MKPGKSVWGIVLMMAITAVGLAQQTPPPPSAPAPGPAVKLEAADLFFTEPYINLDPPVGNLIAMCLDLDYAYIKYPYGFVNTVDLSQPEIMPRKRCPVSAPDQLERIKEKTGFAAGDKVTVVSAQGLFYPGRIVSFSYVGNSPSTIIVAADLRIESDNPDPSLFARHGVALRGVKALPAVRKVFAGKSLLSSDPLQQKLVRLCAADLPAGNIIFDSRVVPAYLESDGAGYYFVSYWRRPNPDFEIEDVKLESCLMRPVGEGLARTELPIPVQVEQVFDLDQDGKAEILALTGDGAEACYVFLAPQGTSYRVLKKGLCAGY